MARTLAWWLSFAESRAACVVETSARGNILDALHIAHERGCNGSGEVRATFVAAAKLSADIPRRLWYRLRTVAEWQACGVDAIVDAVPPGFDPCPLCLAEMVEPSKAIH